MNKTKISKSDFCIFEKKHNLRVVLKNNFMTVGDSTVFVQKPYTVLWLDGKFWLWKKNRFSLVFDVIFSFWFLLLGVSNKCQYNMENVANAPAYLTKILFWQSENSNSSNIAILVQITKNFVPS
jgi:hypothetical protein